MADPSREKRSRKALLAALIALDGLDARRPLAVSLADGLGKAGDLGPKERRAATLLARGVTRELRRVDLLLATATRQALGNASVIPQDRMLLRLLAYRIAIAGEPASRVLDELKLPGPRRPRAIGDDVLAKVAAALPSVDALPSPDDPVRAIAQRRSVPDGLARALADDFGLARADAILAALNVEPRLDLRANRLLGDRDELARTLGMVGIATRPCVLAPDGLIAADRTGLFGPQHQAGRFELQDEGSQLLAGLCAAPLGGLAIDFCAGSGGKAVALAAQVGWKGRVVAFDAVPKRLAELSARARRARASGIVRTGGEEERRALVGQADVVLVDAPCSGLGGMRREADLRWRLDPQKVEGLPALQLSILREAAALVRPGGRLVYGTCSPLRREDEAVVEAFLASMQGFSLQPVREVLPQSAWAATTDDGLYLRTFPDLHDTGAFFGASLRRAG